MRTIRFIKKSRLMPEVHDLSNSYIEDYSLFGNEYQLLIPCNLDIFITNNCPYKCSYCFLDNLEDDCTDEDYFGMLQKTLDELDNKKFEITITGGEPLLKLDRLIKTIEMVHNKGFTFRTIMTVGCNLREEFNNIPIWQHFIKNGVVNNINISKMHYDERKCSNLMGDNSLSNQDIKFIANAFKINDASFRLSANILSDGINSLEEIINYISFYENYDVDYFMFREDVRKNVENIADIKEIMNDIENDDRFKLIETINSDNYIVNVYSFKDYVVKIYDTPIKSGNSNITTNLQMIGNKLFKGYSNIEIGGV